MKKPKTTFWEFPLKIDIEAVCQYSSSFSSGLSKTDMIFDLRETKTVHSSFLGFMLHVKRSLNSNGKQLILYLSQNIEQLLEMLNLDEHFSKEVIISRGKKSA